MNLRSLTKKVAHIRAHSGIPVKGSGGNKKLPPCKFIYVGIVRFNVGQW